MLCYSTCARTVFDTKELADVKLQKAVRHAKCAHENELAKEICTDGMRRQPRKVWNKIRKFQKGSRAHHRPVTGLILQDQETKEIAISAADNVNVVTKHFSQLFNRTSAPIDISVLDDLPPIDPMHELAEPPTAEEVRTILNRLATGKAPGLTNLPVDALKALTGDNLKVTVDLLRKYWTNETEGYPEWKRAALKVLFKGKGSQKDLGNYRGIVLQDAFARIISALIAQRLYRIIDLHGMPEQLGFTPKVGTADATLILRNGLQIRHEHDEETYVLFVDLVKAFDTVNHAMLFEILEKMGAPTALVEILRRLHANFTLEFKIDKDNMGNIAYSIGVRQGDNVAGVLFIFFIQAVITTWKKKIANDPDLKPLTYRYHRPTEKCSFGRMTNQPNPVTTKGKTLIKTRCEPLCRRYHTCS